MSLMPFTRPFGRDLARAHATRRLSALALASSAHQEGLRVSSRGCEVHTDEDGHCGARIADVLVFCNPLTGRDGLLPVCTEHLSQFQSEQDPLYRPTEVRTYTLLLHDLRSLVEPSEPLILKTSVPWEELLQAIRYWRDMLPGCQLEVRSG